MKVRLKTIEQIVDEFETDYDDYDGGIIIEELFIHKDMFKYFGKEIELEQIKDDVYTHVYGYKWWFHESWFAKEEFIEEEEFEV